MVRGKIVEKWSEGKQKLLQVSWGKLLIYSNWLYEGIPGEINLSKRDVPVSERLNNRDD